MIYKVSYHPEVLRKDIPQLNKDLLNRIEKAIDERLAVAPERYGTPLRRTLKGYWKQRVGDYRIVYQVSRGEIFILVIAHRRKVYSMALAR